MSSIPMKRRFSSSATIPVVPLPKNGSRSSSFGQNIHAARQSCQSFCRRVAPFRCSRRAGRRRHQPRARRRKLMARITGIEATTSEGRPPKPGIIVSARESPGRASAEACAVRFGVWGSSLDGRPVVRQKVGERGMIGDAAENVFEPEERIDSDALTGSHELRSTAAVLPPSSLPKNTQLLRPTATPRIARSVPLLSICRSPSSQ